MEKKWKNIPEHTVNFEVVETIENAKIYLQKSNLPLIVKPTKSFGGSRGIMIIKDAKDIEIAFKNAKEEGLKDTKVLIEDVVYGREFSAEVLIKENKTSVLCIGEKIKSPFPYRVDVSVMYPAQLDNLLENKINLAIDKAIKALEITWGVAHIEFCVTVDEQIIFFELGARCGGGHTSLIAKHVSGIDEFVEYCKMACQIESNNFEPVKKEGAIYRFLVFKQGKIKNITVDDSILNNPNILDFELEIQKGDTIPLLKNTSARSGFVISLGKTYSDAFELANETCNKISIEYENGTVDKPIINF